MKKFLKDKKGFTLVEILVVLAIMAILIAVAVPVMVGALNDAKEKTSLADARTAYIAYELKRTFADDDDVTNQQIEDYMGKTGTPAIKCAAKIQANGDRTEVVEFYYTDTNLSGKYAKIVLGDTTTIEAGGLPTGDDIITFK